MRKQLRGFIRAATVKENAVAIYPERLQGSLEIVQQIEVPSGLTVLSRRADVIVRNPIKNIVSLADSRPDEDVQFHRVDAVLFPEFQHSPEKAGGKLGPAGMKYSKRPAPRIVQTNRKTIGDEYQRNNAGVSRPNAFGRKPDRRQSVKRRALVEPVNAV